MRSSSDEFRWEAVCFPIFENKIFHDAVPCLSLLAPTYRNLVRAEAEIL